MASNEDTRKSTPREDNAIFWRATFTLLAVLVLGTGSVAAHALNDPSSSKRAPPITNQNIMMTRYRYYLLDQDRLIRESEPLECETDGEAVFITREILRRRPEFHAAEVWEGTRCIQKTDRTSL
jgi:hypothetical protein